MPLEIGWHCVITLWCKNDTAVKMEDEDYRGLCLHELVHWTPGSNGEP